jgi:hypothetical protein
MNLVVVVKCPEFVREDTWLSRRAEQNWVQRFRIEKDGWVWVISALAVRHTDLSHVEVACLHLQSLKETNHFQYSDNLCHVLLK